MRARAAVSLGQIAQRLWQLLLSRQAFLAFSVALIAYNVLGMRLLYARGNIDYWAHLATMGAFARDPLHPGNPFIPTGEPGYLLVPYHLVWGLIARLLNTHPFWLLPAVAGVNMLLFALGAQAFAQRVIGDRRYALALMLTLLFFWVRPWGWSAFTTFGLFPLTSVYPYWLAMPVALLVMADCGSSARLSRTAWHGAVVGCVFLIHPLTGTFLILGLAAQVLLMTSLPPLRRLSMLAAPSLGALIASLAWPYFPVFGTVLSFGALREGGLGENWRFFYDGALLRLLPSLLGVPLLAWELRKRRVSLAALGLVAAAGVYLLNFLVLHHPTLGRYVVYVAFFGQLGVVLTLRLMERHPLSHVAILAYAAILISLAMPQMVNSVKFIGPLRDLAFRQPIGIHSNASLFRQYGRLREHLGRGDVVMAPLEVGTELPGMVGCAIVGLQFHNPYMHNHQERRAAVERFFSSDASDVERVEILDRYAVTHVLVTRDQAEALASLVPRLVLQYSDLNHALYRLP